MHFLVYSDAHFITGSRQEHSKLEGSDSDRSAERLILLPCRRMKWSAIEITEDKLKQEWRKKVTLKLKNSETCEYYCAYGKDCPAKIKKKTLPNGVTFCTRNEADHLNHRTSDFGLTKEQKELVLECLNNGVVLPTNILQTFKFKNTS